jgi:hypothetical protein
LVDSTIDKTAYYREVDAMCEEVKKEIEGYKTPQELIERINNYLFQKEKFKFNTDADNYFFGTESERDEVKKKGVHYKEFILMLFLVKLQQLQNKKSNKSERTDRFNIFGQLFNI